MIEFKIPLKDSSFFTFKLDGSRLMFAGSRYIDIKPDIADDLIKAFGSIGFKFMTGCANGVDSSFRRALSVSEYKDSTIIACAFKERANIISGTGLTSLFVVPDNLNPKVALAKRTLWMCSRCSMLILFPSDPIGKGSALAFKSAIYNNKPVFVVSKTRPKDSSLYTVMSSNLFGVVDGFWCVPPVYKETGLCFESV